MMLAKQQQSYHLQGKPKIPIARSLGILRMFVNLFVAVHKIILYTLFVWGSQLTTEHDHILYDSNSTITVPTE